MTTGIFYPANSLDDGHLYATALNKDYPSIILGDYANGVGFHSWVRFQNITVEPGSVISSAYIKLTASASDSSNNVNVLLYFNDADDASYPDSANDFLSKAKTSSVSWNAIAAWTNGVQYNSPELASILQDVIDRPGWESGNSVMILIFENSSTPGAERYFSSYDYNFGSEKAELHIVYTPIYNVELDEFASASELITSNMDTIDESVSANESFDDTIHLQPLHGILDEEASVADVFDESVQADLNELASASDSFDDNNSNLDEFIYANDHFELHGTTYTKDVVETGRVRDQIHCPSQVTLDHSLTVSDLLYSLLDGLAENISANDQPAFVYERDIAEDATATEVFDRHLAYFGDLAENVSADDSILTSINLTLLEALFTWDTPYSSWIRTIAESVTSTDILTLQLLIQLAEYLAAKEALAENWMGQEPITETVYIRDAVTLIQAIELAIAESLVSTDTALPITGILISEYINLKEALTGNSTLFREISDALIAVDSVVASWFENIAEALTSTDSVSLHLSVLVQEYLETREAITNGLAYSDSLSEAIIATDSAVAGWLKSLAETIASSATVSVDVCILVQEYLKTSDIAIGGLATSKEIIEAIEIVDSAVAGWLKGLAETISASDVALVDVCILVQEYLKTSETISGGLSASKEISEVLAMVDSAVAGWLKSLVETITSTETISVDVCILVQEYLKTSEFVSGGLSTSKEILEAIAVTDLVVSSWIKNLIENVTTEDSITVLLQLRASETLSVIEVLSSTGTFYRGLAEIIIAADSVSRGFAFDLSDSLSSVDIATVFTQFYNNIAESLVSVDTITATNTIAITTTEAITLVDTVGSGATLYLSITDGVILNTTITLDDEVYECFVLNSPKFFPSVYSGFDFNSYCLFRNRAFAANNTGIFELDGETDNDTDISSGVLLHETDFGARNKKRFRKGYIGIDGTGAKMIMETGEGTRKVYDIDTKGIVDASRSIQGKEWQLSVTDFDTIETLTLIPVILSRSI